MTEAETAALAKEVAGVVREAIRRAIEPYAQRLATVEATTAAAIAETRTACLRDLVEVRERVAVVETREPVPGPPGPEGPRGADGKSGLEFRKKYSPGDLCERGDFVVWNGSGWYCNETTTNRPGDGSGAWTLFVKNGNFAKDVR